MASIVVQRETLDVHQALASRRAPWYSIDQLVYAQVGPKSSGDIFVCACVTSDFADQVAESHNAVRKTATFR